MWLVPKGVYFKPSEKVKPASHAIWPVATAPLLTLIEKAPMTIAAILEWGIVQGHTGSMIRHQVGWLSFKDKIYFDVDAAVWRVGAEPPKLDYERISS